MYPRKTRGQIKLRAKGQKNAYKCANQDIRLLRRTVKENLQYRRRADSFILKKFYGRLDSTADVSKVSFESGGNIE